jgi:tetratricopeptide (TPR) repeat protein
VLVGCPPEEAFAQLLDDTPPEDIVAEIESHAGSCARCRELLEKLATDAPSLSVQRLARTAARLDTRPPGARVGRYVIERTLGHGGMGVVYAAHDPDLDRRVAVKLLRPDQSGSAAEQRRLLVREAQAMARLQHNNVITVYEVGTADDCTFIAMELVDGGTLRSWLAASPRDWRDIVRMFVAAGEGLHAAHAVGLVHRDFKPDNVLVARNGHIRVTDFGLARLAANHPMATTAAAASGMAMSRVTMPLTRSGAVAGTPRYMAPEQLRGGSVDARTDVFSFSVALYEALFGQPPFAGASMPELEQAIAADAIRPPPPGTRVPARVVRLLRWGLRRDPAARPADLEQLLAELRPALRPRLPWVVAALAGCVLVAGATLAMTTRRPTPIVARPRQALAVLPLAGSAANGDSAWLGPVLAEVVGAGLHAAGGPRLVPIEDIARMLRELALPTTATLPAEARRRVQADLRADYVVSGEIIPAGGGALRLVLRLVDLATGRTLATADERGDQASLAALAMRASAQLRLGIGARTLATSDGEAARAALPTRPDALRAYGRGLFALQLGDNVQAARWFGEAATLEPEHAYSHLMLAMARRSAGDVRKAEAAAARAFALSAGLERDEQLTIEAVYRELHHEYDRAVEIYRALLSFFPDRVDWALGLARVQAHARRPADCQATLEALRRLPPPDAEDPSIDVAEAWCVEVGGDYDKMRTFAARARERAEKRGARLLAARAGILEAHALLRQGQPDTAMQRLVDAQAVFHELGDTGMEVRAIVAQGDLWNDRRNFAKARERYEKVLPTVQAEGDVQTELELLNNLAIGAEPTRARTLYQQVMELARSNDDPFGVILATSNLAMLDANNDEMTAAVKGYTETLRLARQLGAHMFEALSLDNLCGCMRRTGDPAGALANCDQAAAIYAKSSNRTETVSLALTRAAVLDDLGRHAAAAATARQAASDAHTHGATPIEVMALSELATALVNERRLREAGEAIATARARLATESQTEAAVYVALAAARLQAVAAHTAAARLAAAQAAAQAAELAHAGSFITNEREARLLQYQLSYAAGQATEAKAPLTALESASRRAGDLLVARRAAALLQHR